MSDQEVVPAWAVRLQDAMTKMEEDMAHMKSAMKKMDEDTNAAMKSAMKKMDEDTNAALTKIKNDVAILSVDVRYYLASVERLSANAPF